MDDQRPQSGGPPLPEGHDDSDLNIRGVVWFGAFLAAGGVVAFLLMGLAMWGLEKWAKNHEAKLTPVQQQLHDQRDGRGEIEEHLTRTFATPRVQYNDEHDMNNFRGSENEWLASTGKNAKGGIHIPVSRAMELLVQQGLPPVSGPFLPANASAPSAAILNGGVEPPARAQRLGANHGGAKP